MNDGTGATVADSSGNGETGTLEGSPTAAWASGDNGYDCLSFPATETAYMDSENFADNLPTFTVSCWFKTTNKGVNPVNEFPLVEKATSGGTGAGTGWFFGIAGPNEVPGYPLWGFLQNNNGNSWVGSQSAVAVNDGKWHFAVMVVSNAVAGKVLTTQSASPLSLYLDGVLQTTSWSNFPFTNGISNSNHVRVACAYAYGPNYFSGNIQDVRISGSAWTAATISSLYTAGPQ
jgi:hypothetical protein